MKNFRSINQQIKLLIERGVKFSSIKTAKEILSRKNFYNLINGYKKLFCTNIEKDIYIQDISFDEIYSLYNLDTNIKHLFLKYVLIVEQEFKTHVAYEFARTRGATKWDILDNYDKDTEKSTEDAKKLIDLLNGEIGKSKKDSQDDLIAHFDKIPIWAFVNIFSFGLIKKFYLCMKEEDKSFIANNYYKISFTYLRSFLEALNMYRNVFAHNFRVLFYRIKDADKQIKDTPIHSQLYVDKQDNKYLYGKNDLFSIVIVLKYLLSEKDFKSFYDSLISIFDTFKKRIHSINYKKVIASVGFFEESKTKNWKNIISVEK